jgi:hypothetical protein
MAKKEPLPVPKLIKVCTSLEESQERNEAFFKELGKLAEKYKPLNTFISVSWEYESPGEPNKVAMHGGMTGNPYDALIAARANFSSQKERTVRSLDTYAR